MFLFKIQKGKNMNKFNVTMIAIGLAISFGAIADESMTKEAYKSEKERIELEYKSDKAKCQSLSDNAKDICKVEAKGKEEVAEAELSAKYKPSKKSNYKAHIAKAKVDYKIAKEKSDDLTGSSKDVCQKEAKAAMTAAKTDAKAQMETLKAD